MVLRGEGGGSRTTPGWYLPGDFFPANSWHHCNSTEKLSVLTVFIPKGSCPAQISKYISRQNHRDRDSQATIQIRRRKAGRRWCGSTLTAPPSAVLPILVWSVGACAGVGWLTLHRQGGNICANVLTSWQVHLHPHACPVGLLPYPSGASFRRISCGGIHNEGASVHPIVEIPDPLMT